MHTFVHTRRLPWAYTLHLELVQSRILSLNQASTQGLTEISQRLHFYWCCRVRQNRASGTKRKRKRKETLYFMMLYMISNGPAEMTDIRNPHIKATNYALLGLPVNGSSCNLSNPSLKSILIQHATFVKERVVTFLC